MCFKFFTTGLKPSFELWKEGGGGGGGGGYIKRSLSTWAQDLDPIGFPLYGLGSTKYIHLWAQVA